MEKMWTEATCDEEEVDQEETLSDFYIDFLDRMFQGLDYYVNSTIKRHEYFSTYYENGTFKNLLKK